MKFKPFSNKYDFSNAKLEESFPHYLLRPISRWIHDILNKNDIGYNRYSSLSSTVTNLREGYINRLQTLLREQFSDEYNKFITKIFSDSELTCNILAIMLQNYADQYDAVKLEIILSDGGSAYSVEKTNKTASEYENGVYDLVKRVPDEVKKQSESALTNNELIREAWEACYSRNPDYEKTVTRCCDVLEHVLKDKYEPENKKPQLGMLIKNLKGKPDKLNYKGASLLSSKYDLLKLVENATTVRGNHTAGTGRSPEAGEAEFLLHSTILIWNMHEGI